MLVQELETFNWQRLSCRFDKVAVSCTAAIGMFGLLRLCDLNQNENLLLLNSIIPRLTLSILVSISSRSFSFSCYFIPMELLLFAFCLHGSFSFTFV